MKKDSIGVKEDFNILRHHIDGFENKEEDIREIFALSFEFFKMSEAHKTIYKRDINASYVKRLISLYYKDIKPDYSTMIYLFKKKYIYNESLVEKNDSKEERKGLGLVYDYIQNFNPATDYFNIMITAMNIHILLYKFLDDERNKEIENNYLKIKKELEIAKKNKDVRAYRELKKKLMDCSQTFDKFGGRLRDGDVTLLDTDVKVPSAEEAKIYFNSFLSKEKMIEYQNVLSSTDIFGYVEYCVKTIVDLIRYQMFNDGNKRTFRSLLNLMFKNKNLPPVYITTGERKQYKDALFKAMELNDYKDIINFYYYKICDSIYELDIKPYMEKFNNKDNNNLVRKKDAK